MINNNKLKIEFNYDNICRDYDIYKISKEEGYFDKGYRILDIPEINFKAESVYIATGRQMFVLIEKGLIEKDELKKALLTEYDDINVESIVAKQEYADEEKTRIYDNQLAQLLINKLKNPKNKQWSYNNLTGGLFYWNPEWKYSSKKTGAMERFWTVKIEISFYKYLKLGVKTFTKTQSFSNVKDATFCFDEKTYSFRRALQVDSNRELYSMTTFNSSYHNTVDFLKFMDFENFKASKMGVLAQFLHDVGGQLSDYMKVELDGYENYKVVELADETFSLGKKAYADILKTLGVNLIDVVNNQESEKLVVHIKEQLQKFYGVGIIEHEPIKDSFNIRIIRNCDYYKEHEEVDQHDSVGSEYVVQHVTVDDFKVKSNDRENPAIAKIVQEMLIKRDVRNQKITMANWNSICEGRTWTFVRRIVKKDSINGKGVSKKDKKYIYIKMKVNQNGCFELDRYQSDEITMDSEWKEIRQCYAQCDENEWKSERHVEGLVYCDINNINIISKTEQFTVPQIEKIYNALELSKKSRNIDCEELIACTKEFGEECGKYIEDVKRVIDELEINEEEYVSYEVVNNVLNMKSGFGREVNSFLYLNYGILINPRLKKGDVVEEIFSSNLDIKYFYQNNKLLYFVGKRSKGDLKQSIDKACIVREVSALNGDVEFEEIMKLMKVDFVRNGQFTVLPFPFKYLREYERIM